MLKTASFVPILLTAWITPTVAADCLQQIDSITVEFDLPAAQSIVGTQSGSAYYVPPPPTDDHAPPPPQTMTPPGRPGAPRGGLGGTTEAAPLLPHERLSTAQRTKLQAILQQARSVEALGKEPECFELLGQAQAITKQKG
jgi:hypothetical protein